MKEQGEVSASTDGALPDPTNQAAFRKDIWLKSFVGALGLMGPALALGLTRDLDDPVDEDGDGWSRDVLLQVALPGFVVFTATNAIMSRMPTTLGFAMLREIGSDVSLKESIRTNMTNNGVVLALLLTMLLAMWQADPNETPHQRNEMWYRMLLIFGIEACTRGAVMVSLFLLYLEPLGDAGPWHFAVDNMLYLGEPASCIGLTMVYFVQSCVLWVFNTDAKVMGCLAYLVLGYCIMRTLVVAQYLQDWNSPTVSNGTRHSRTMKLISCKAVDGTG